MTKTDAAPKTKTGPSPWPFGSWPEAYAARDAARAIRAAAHPAGEWPSMATDRQLAEPATWTAPEPAEPDDADATDPLIVRIDGEHRVIPARVIPAEPDAGPQPGDPDDGGPGPLGPGTPRWRIVEPLTGATLGTVEA